MDPEFLPLASWLQATGPFGLVVVLAWAYSKLNEKKDAMLRDLYAEVVEMGRAQTEAVIKMEAALVALKGAIDELRRTSEEDQYWIQKLPQRRIPLPRPLVSLMN